MSVKHKYQFPLDLKKVNYNATISFQAVELQAYDVATLLGALSKVDQSVEDPGADVTGIAKAAHDAENAYNRGAHNNNHQNFHGQQYETLAGSHVDIKKRLDVCKLYLPQAIQINDGAQYDNINLGIMGATAAAGMNAGDGILDAAWEGIKEGGAGFIDAFRTKSMGSSQARLAVSRAAAKIPGQGLTGAIQGGTRVAVNPNTRAMFKGVPLREFTFTFKMIPTSKKESEEIKNIIKFFRTELYPAIIPLGDGAKAIAAGYEFPNVFEITMNWKDKDQIATKILPSYLRNFTATYNASSMGFHEGGDFTEVDISMTFMEHATLHKGLIGEGY